MAMDRVTVVRWDWHEDDVRQALHVPLDDVWQERVMQLELQDLASFTMYAAPTWTDEDGVEHGLLNWRDLPREELGSVTISPMGVLKLAALYGRPYVTFAQGPDVLIDHWELVQNESAARMTGPHDEARLAREWPEQTLLWKAQLEEQEKKHLTEE
jgi:hypothetical protein